MAKLKSSARNLGDVRELNLSMIIKLMQKLKICSRADLAKSTGLRQSTITNIVNEMIDCGLVSETGNIEGAKGRRSIGITFNSHLFNVISIRLTRNSFIVGRFDISGKENSIITHPIASGEQVDETLSKIESCVDTLIKMSQQRIIGIGIAVPGPLLNKEDRILLMTGSSGWENVNFREYFNDRFKMPVYVEHDANAGALAEWWFSNENFELGTFVYVAAGQGIGAGVMTDGKIMHGVSGIAGEIGHMCINFDGPRCQCGNFGCLENYCSVMALMKAINQGIDDSILTILKKGANFEQVVEAVHKNDVFAMTTTECIAGYLGIGLANIVNLYNPGTIIIGDELSRLDNFLNHVQQTIQSHVLPEISDNLSVRLTSFKHDPALIGAVALVVDKVLKKPTDILQKSQFTY